VLASAAAAVLIVGGGASALSGRGGSGSSASQGSADTSGLGANGAGKPRTRSPAVPAPGGSAGVGTEAASAACPAATPSAAATSVVRDEPLLPTDATTVRVCVYRSDRPAAPVYRQRLLGAAQTHALVAALNAEAPFTGTISCAVKPRFVIALLAGTADGQGGLAVSAAGDCYVLSNGRTRREGYARLAPLIAQLTGG
nr:hypothetical protein [Actinomycetota bacterium]